MAKVGNNFNTYYALGIANTQRQANEIGEIMKKRNSEGW